MSLNLMILMIVIPLLGAFFALSVKNNKNYSKNNVYNVSMWTLFINTLVILYNWKRFKLLRFPDFLL